MPTTDVVLEPNVALLSILYDYYCRILQTLRFDFTYFLFGNLTLFVSYAMRIRPKPKKDGIAVHGY